jgi:hypothetical protein
LPPAEDTFKKREKKEKTMTWRDTWILGMHAVILFLWYIDSKALEFKRTQRKYRKMINSDLAKMSQADIQGPRPSRPAHDYQINASSSQQLWMFTKHKGRDSFYMDIEKRREEQRRNHPANRHKPGSPDAGMFWPTNNDWKKQQRRRPRKGIFTSMDELIRFEKNRRRRRGK